MGVHWKKRFLGGFTKNQYVVGICLKSGAWAVCRFMEYLEKKRGAGWHPNAH